MIDYAYIAKEQDFEDGELILEEGKFSDWLYVIIEGKVKIFKDGPHGRVNITTLGTGEILGELGFIEAGRMGRSASAVARGDVKLGIIDKDKLAREFSNMSPTFRSIVRTLVERVRFTTEVAAKQAARMK